MSEFTEKVLEIVNNIPKGKVASYGQVALMAGVPRGARQVGWVLHNNGDRIPWWRVINNEGRISIKCPEYTAAMQRDYLEKDGVKTTQKLGVDIDKYRWRPKIEELKKFRLSENYIETIIEKYQL